MIAGDRSCATPPPKPLLEPGDLLFPLEAAFVGVPAVPYSDGANKQRSTTIILWWLRNGLESVHVGHGHLLGLGGEEKGGEQNSERHYCMVHLLGLA